MIIFTDQIKICLNKKALRPIVRQSAFAFLKRVFAEKWILPDFDKRDVGVDTFEAYLVSFFHLR